MMVPFMIYSGISQAWTSAAAPLTGGIEGHRLAPFAMTKSIASIDQSEARRVIHAISTHEEITVAALDPFEPGLCLVGW